MNKIEIIEDTIKRCLERFEKSKRNYVKELVEYGEAGFMGQVMLDEDYYIMACVDFKIRPTHPFGKPKKKNKEKK